uniref:Uncharacterized protein n=2 Tax=viral metagenome TaxID=1070528 RepID=A0A6M3JT57_9ZZZZ
MENLNFKEKNMPSQEDLDRISLDYEDEFEEESSREKSLENLINRIQELDKLYKEEIKKIREEVKDE